MGDWLSELDEPDELRRVIPPVDDRLLLELANSVEVTADLIRYRRTEGFFSGLMAKLNGAAGARRMRLDAELVGSQDTLTQWMVDLAEGSRITNLGLTRAVGALEATIERVDALAARSQHHGDAIAALTSAVQGLAAASERRFAVLEQRVEVLELKDAARDCIEDAVSSWQQGRTYPGMPWPFQVALLAREVYASRVAAYEALTGDDVLRRRLVDAVVEGVQRPAFSIGGELDRCTSAVPLDGLLLLAELLDAGAGPAAPLGGPYTSVLRAAAELGALGIERPGEHALELTRRRVGNLDYTSDVRSFAEAIVAETALLALSICATSRPAEAT